MQLGERLSTVKTITPCPHAVQHDHYCTYILPDPVVLLLFANECGTQEMISRASWATAVFLSESTLPNVALQDVLALNQLVQPKMRLAPCTRDALLFPARQSLAKFHPSAVGVRSNQYLFIAVHQCFEVWMHVVVSLLLEAREALHQTQHDDAVRSIQRVTRIFSFLEHLFPVLQEIGVADYLLFRHELAGSGLESINFRKAQLLMGMRDDAWYGDLFKMHMVTDELDQLWQGPSLHSALHEILSHRKLGSTPQDIAKCMIPTQIVHPHADLSRLIQALLTLSKQVKQWESNHALMVATMIGDRNIISIGDVTAKTNTLHLGGLAYLQRVRDRPPLFPELVVAVSFAQPYHRDNDKHSLYQFEKEPVS